MTSPADRRRILSLHVAVAVVVPGFLALCAWQVMRALSGNSLSWAYVFEWPIFAGYAVYVWWKLTHEESRSRGLSDASEAEPSRADPEASVSAQTDKADQELASYNEYLAALNASGPRKRR